jgi:hypothetical protein
MLQAYSVSGVRTGCWAFFHTFSVRLKDCGECGAPSPALLAGEGRGEGTILFEAATLEARSSIDFGTPHPRPSPRENAGRGNLFRGSSETGNIGRKPTVVMNLWFTLVLTNQST